ncbi:unnamed protein product [Malus baccata var. baccata]
MFHSLLYTYIPSEHVQNLIRGGVSEAFPQSIFVSSSSLTIFKVIPDPFQSLNTKGSIFKDYFNMFNVIYYFISLTIFKVIPDLFQSLNTKGYIFKVSLQTYIYIIVIYTTTNKFVWTRMLIFLSN